MIPTVHLGKSDINTSRLGFGTSRLHHLFKPDRQHLLAAAADLGFMHFDTAPVYGDGICETELGIFIRGQRERYVIVTKYGISPDPLVEACPWLSLPLRAVRVVARGVEFRPSTLPILTPSGLRASVERSLRRLRTDYIDILLLHEPRQDRIHSSEDVVNALHKLQRGGLIRAFGLAGGWDGINSVLSAAPVLGMVVQTAEYEWIPEVAPDITYGAIAPGPQTYFARAIKTSDAAQQLRVALGRRPSGVVLVSTTNLKHLLCVAEVAAETKL